MSSPASTASWAASSESSASSWSSASSTLVGGADAYIADPVLFGSSISDDPTLASPNPGPRNKAFRAVDHLTDLAFGQRDPIDSDYALRRAKFWTTCQTNIKQYNGVWRPVPPPKVMRPDLIPDSVLTVKVVGDPTPRRIPVHAYELASQAVALASLGLQKILQDNLDPDLYVHEIEVPSLVALAPVFEYLYFNDLDRLRYRILHPLTDNSPPYPTPLMSDQEVVNRLVRTDKAKLDLMVATAVETQKICRDWGFQNRTVQTVVDVAVGLLVMVQMTR